MESVALVALGWTSGINAYLTVLMLGVAGRFGWAETPDAFQRPWVLAATGALFAVEFIVDKVPYLDSAWDTVHTAIRPVIGALVGVQLAQGDLGSLSAALAGGGLALLGHGTKSTTRLAINASPEPFTNVVASVTEDGLVATLVVLSLTHPRVAAAAAGVAIVIGLIVAVVLWRLVRRGWRRLLQRRQDRSHVAQRRAG
jgi:hypothetical protein